MTIQTQSELLRKDATSACMIDKILFEQAPLTVLREHNKYRRAYNLPRLRLNKKLSKEAENYARLYAAYGVNSDAVAKPDYDYNVDSKPKTEANPACITAGWYMRLPQLVRYAEAPWEEIEIVARMLWKSTSQIGVGMAINDAIGMYVLVCFYHPRLNREEYVDNFEKPVLEVYVDGFPSGAMSTKPIATYALTMMLLTRIC